MDNQYQNQIPQQSQDEQSKKPFVFSVMGIILSALCVVCLALMFYLTLTFPDNLTGTEEIFTVFAVYVSCILLNLTLGICSIIGFILSKKAKKKLINYKEIPKDNIDKKIKSFYTLSKIGTILNFIFIIIFSIFSLYVIILFLIN